MKFVLENIFMRFGNILKILFSYKFSHFLSYFLSFQTYFILQNPPPPTHQHPQKIHHHPHTSTHKKSTTIHTKPTTTQHKNHQITSTHTTTKKKIRGGQRDWEGNAIESDDLTQRRMARSRCDFAGINLALWSRRRDLGTIERAARSWCNLGAIETTMRSEAMI